MRFILLLTLTISAFSLTLTTTVLAHPIAQIRGSDSNDALEIEPKNPNQEEIQLQEPTLEQEEQKLEQNLNIQEQNPDAPKFESIPDIDVDDNEPFPPSIEEDEIIFPE